MDGEVQAKSAIATPFSLRGLVRNLFTVGTFATLAKLMGGVKVAVTARYFGAGGELDAYLIAFLLPSFIADVFAGSISSALVPALARMQGDDARNLCRSVLSAGTGLLAALAVVLGAASFVVPFPASRRDLVRSLLFVLLPLVPLSAMSVTCRAVLNSQGRFWVAAATQVVTPTFTVLLLFATANRWGVYSLAMGTLFGNMMEVAFLAANVRRLGFPIVPRWPVAVTEELRAVFAQYIPMVAGALVLGGSTFVDQGFATLMGTGGIAILTYGTKLTSVMLALGPAALGTAILPYLSKISAEENWTELRLALRRFLLVIAAVTIPVTAVLMVFSEPLVRLYLQRGQFSAEVTAEVSRVQQFSLVHVPIAVTLALAMGLTASLRANRLLLRVAFAGLVTNAVFDLILMRYFGVAGIAASDSVAGLVMLGYLGLLLHRRLVAS